MRTVVNYLENNSVVKCRNSDGVDADWETLQMVEHEWCLVMNALVEKGNALEIEFLGRGKISNYGIQMEKGLVGFGRKVVQTTPGNHAGQVGDDGVKKTMEVEAQSAKLSNRLKSRIGWS
jgi:hypothetical protein